MIFMPASSFTAKENRFAITDASFLTKQIKGDFNCGQKEMLP